MLFDFLVFAAPGSVPGAALAGVFGLLMAISAHAVGWIARRMPHMAPVGAHCKLSSADSVAQPASITRSRQV